MPLTLTIKEYSEHSGVSVKALRRLIADGKIPATKISNKFMILVSDADDYIINSCIKNTGSVMPSPKNIDDWFSLRKTAIVN